MRDRDPLNFRKAAYTAADWQRREEIFERVLSGKMLTKIDQVWLEKQGMRRWERHGKQIL